MAGFGRGIVHQIFHQRAQRVGRAKVLDEARNGVLHELLARAAEPIAGRAKTRDIAIDQQFADHGVQRANVAQFELFAFHLLRSRPPRCSRQFDAAAGIDLRTPKPKISRRNSGGSRAVQISPVYGTDSRKIATSRLKSSSPTRCVSSIFTPQAGRSRGKLIVWGPTL